jgi:hypothetical protein
MASNAATAARTRSAVELTLAGGVGLEGGAGGGDLVMTVDER